PSNNSLLLASRNTPAYQINLAISSGNHHESSSMQQRLKRSNSSSIRLLISNTRIPRNHRRHIAQFEPSSLSNVLQSSFQRRIAKIYGYHTLQSGRFFPTLCRRCDTSNERRGNIS